MLFFLIIGFLASTPFSPYCTRRSDAHAINLRILVLLVLTRFATYNLGVVSSFSFHLNNLARYILNKRTLHRPLKYHDKIDQWQI
jgi:hypothetical protein